MKMKHCWVYSSRHVYGDIHKHFEAGVIFDSRNKYKMEGYEPIYQTKRVSFYRRGMSPPRPPPVSPHRTPLPGYNNPIKDQAFAIRFNDNKR